MPKPLRPNAKKLKRQDYIEYDAKYENTTRVTRHAEAISTFEKRWRATFLYGVEATDNKVGHSMCTFDRYGITVSTKLTEIKARWLKSGADDPFYNKAKQTPTALVEAANKKENGLYDPILKSRKDRRHQQVTDASKRKSSGNNKYKIMEAELARLKAELAKAKGEETVVAPHADVEKVLKGRNELPKQSSVVTETRKSKSKDFKASTIDGIESDKFYSVNAMIHEDDFKSLCKILGKDSVNKELKAYFDRLTDALLSNNKAKIGKVEALWDVNFNNNHENWIKHAIGIKLKGTYYTALIQWLNKEEITKYAIVKDWVDYTVTKKEQPI